MQKIAHMNLKRQQYKNVNSEDVLNIVDAGRDFSTPYFVDKFSDTLKYTLGNTMFYGQ
jgi:hypothetical protein